MKKIETIADEYQNLHKQAKEMEAKLQGMRRELVKYVQEHRGELDSEFRFKFLNGVYVSLRVSDVLNGDNDAKDMLMRTIEDEDCINISLNDKAVISKAAKDERLRKMLTVSGLSVGQKEVWAVYAN